MTAAGPRSAIHSFCLVPSWTTAHGLAAAELAAAHGFDHLVIPLRDHSVIEPAVLAHGLERLGIVPLTTSNLSPATDVSSVDAEVRARGVAHHMDSLRIARDLGSPHVGGALHGASFRYQDAPTAANWDAAVQSVGLVADAAAGMGLTLAIELVNRYENHLINTIEQGVRFLDDVGAPNLFLHLDTFHMNIEEPDPLVALRDAVARVRYFEVDQNDRGLLSAGALDFAPYARVLVEAGYAGYVGAEGFSSAVSDPSVAAGAAIWRETYPDAGTFAADAAAVLSRFSDR